VNFFCCLGLPISSFLFAFGSSLGQALCVLLKLPQERKKKKVEIFLEVNITINVGMF
jgi:hypothetical protein